MTGRRRPPDGRVPPPGFANAATVLAMTVSAWRHRACRHVQQALDLSFEESVRRLATSAMGSGGRGCRYATIPGRQ